MGHYDPTRARAPLFIGIDDQARPAAELCRLAEKIEQTYPELVRARVVSAERFAADALLVDLAA